MKLLRPIFFLCSCAAAAALIISSLTIQSNSPSANKLKDAKTAQHLDLKDARTILAIILAAIGASVSSAGGIGGGGLFVPLFNLLLRFNTRTAAVLSNFMIFGGMIANMMWSSAQRDPFDPEKPLIDFDAALLMQPNMLLGISLGVLCNLMFPGWLITLLLTITLVIVTVRSCKCGFRLWRGESCCGELVVGVESADDKEDQKDKGELTKPDLEAPLLLDHNPDEVELEEPPTRCCPGTQISKIAALLLVWLFFFGVQLFRGSRSTEGYFHLEECSTGYWLITASQLPITFIFTVCFVWQAHRESTSNPKSKWTGSKAHLILPITAFFAGVLGGLLGIGGGMLLSPILLEFGLPPQVTAATTAFMVFFSSSLSVVQYWLMGRIPVDYALCFSVVSFFFSLAGLVVVQRAIQKYGRASIIVFLVASVMGLSAILMAGFGSMDVWNQFVDGEYMGFRSPC